MKVLKRPYADITNIYSIKVRNFYISVEYEDGQWLGTFIDHSKDVEDAHQVNDYPQNLFKQCIVFVLNSMDDSTLNIIKMMNKIK